MTAPRVTLKDSENISPYAILKDGDMKSEVIMSMPRNRRMIAYSNTSLTALLCDKILSPVKP